MQFYFGRLYYNYIINKFGVSFIFKMKENMLENDKDDPDSTGQYRLKNYSVRLFTLKLTGAS